MKILEKFLKKKKKEKESIIANNTIEKNKEKNKEYQKLTNFLKKEKIKTKLGFFDKINYTLPDFFDFLDNLQDIIISNKDKPNFTKKEALKQLAIKFKLSVKYKKFASSVFLLSSAFNNEIQVLYVLKRQKKGFNGLNMYWAFQEVILEKDLNKTLSFIKILKQYKEFIQDYKKAHPLIGPIINLYVFGIVFSIIQVIAMPVILYKSNIVYPVDFIKYRPSSWELQIGLPILSLISDISFLLKIQIILQLIIIFFFPLLFLYFFGKTLYTYLQEKNKRLIDKFYNEVHYYVIAFIKIIQLKLEGENRYIDVDYISFLKKIGKIGYDRGLINLTWFEDFSKLNQIFESVNKIIDKKQLPYISELFYNNYVYILDLIRNSYTGRLSDFSLTTIYNRFEETTNIIFEINKQKAEKIKGTISSLSLYLSLAIMGIALLYTFQQSNQISSFFQKVLGINI